jgi:hypothetical protein
MKQILTITLFLPTILLWGQTQQVIEYYDLRKNPGTAGFTTAIIDGVMLGNLLAYDYNNDQPKNLSAIELKNRLIYSKAPEYDNWDSSIQYFLQDRVQYNGKIWEVIQDSFAGTGTVPRGNGQEFWLFSR